MESLGEFSPDAAEHEVLSEMEQKSREPSAAAEESSFEAVPVAQTSELVTRAALVPTAPGANAKVPSNPFEEFRCSPSRLDAADRCLKAACSVLHFVISEIWTYGGDYKATEGKSVEPVHLHVYTKGHTIDGYSSRVKEMLSWYGKVARDSVSSELVYQARKRENGLVWYTSASPDTPLGPELPIKTAVALLVSLDMFRKDLCFVFFADDDVKPQDSFISILRQLSRAAGVALAPDFPASEMESMNSSMREGESPVRAVEDQPGRQELPVRLDIRWDELRNVEFMANGGRCTIYTAIYGSDDVVAKVMRKDSKDKDAVQKELELEMSLLLRLRHPNIVRLVGAGLHPEPFLLIERLDGGTLAQRCGNAPKIRDRRRRFRYAKPFMYDELLQNGIQLAEALDYMHSDVLPGKLVMHRDLKPDNIAFMRDGTLKLIDLGMGKVVTKSSEDNAVYRLTGETGSLRYMAPEVALTKPYNAAADVYSFAIVFWEMATMKKPFAGMGFQDYYREVVHAGVRPELNATWPEELCGLLRDAWSQDMNERPSFKDIKSILTRLLDAWTASDAKARSIQRGPRRTFGLLRSKGKSSKSPFS